MFESFYKAGKAALARSRTRVPEIDGEGVFCICGEERPDCVADIVFIHGLGGASHKTWRHGRREKAGHFFWPEELGKDLGTCAVWTLGYPAGFTGIGPEGMIIEKRAGNIAHTLANAKLGRRPIVFVAHSLGGLVLKHLIVDSVLTFGEDRKRIVEQIKGIVFCGTPHRGSAFADAAEVFGVLGGGSQAHVKEMRANRDGLDLLHDKFIEWHRLHPIPVRCYAESKKLRLTRWLLFATDHGVVVPRASANAGLQKCETHDADEDHLSLVKPENRTGTVYAGSLDFIRRCLAATPLGEGPDNPSRAVATERAVTAAVKVEVDVWRILRQANAAPIGREACIEQLNTAVLAPLRRIMTCVAFGGVGKTTLLAHWLSRLAAENWTVGGGRGGGSAFERVFAWSFFSQGAREQGAGHAEPFFDCLLAFFGDRATAASNLGAEEKGKRLAELFVERRTLLVIDGLEAVQYPPGPMAGHLKDRGLSAFLTSLATAPTRDFCGSLCVMGSRDAVAELEGFGSEIVERQPLEFLSDAAGAHLLHRAGATYAGAAAIAPTDEELQAASREFHGHALTLRILGAYLKLAAGGDIRRRAEIRLGDADRQFQAWEDGAGVVYGYAFKAVDAYARWLGQGGEEGARQLAVLSLLGLFDRPASVGCLQALRAPPVIPGLTESLVNATTSQWDIAVQRLADCGLVLASEDGPVDRRHEGALDTHSLVREYFAGKLRTQQPAAWKKAHHRLYDCLRTQTQEGEQPTLSDLLPLYQAVTHGCEAGETEAARASVFRKRIRRNEEAYSVRRLGAIGSDLGALTCFFDPPWTALRRGISESGQAWLRSEAAFCLRALGRSEQALGLMRAALESVKQRAAKAADRRREQSFWGDAAACAINLSELELLLGDISTAIDVAEQAGQLAGRSGDRARQVAAATAFADALHQAGRREAAAERFRQAESKQRGDDQEFCSLRGFQYCDLLISPVESAAWQVVLRTFSPGAEERTAFRAALDDIEARATHGLRCAEGEAYGALLDRGLYHAMLSRVGLCRARLGDDFTAAEGKPAAERAVEVLRAAGMQNYLPLGLLIRACWSSHRNEPDAARADLDSAEQIAVRGSMKLLQADIHLHRARLFRDRSELQRARVLVERCGYFRRNEEISDGEEAMSGE